MVLDALVLTRDEEGMSLFIAGKDNIHLPIMVREVFDVTGAGDTVFATIGLGLAGGLDLQDAVTLANLAAGVVVGREVVENYGGRVELINLVDGKSTTNIISKILEQYSDN